MAFTPCRSLQSLEDANIQEVSHIKYDKDQGLYKIKTLGCSSVALAGTDVPPLCSRRLSSWSPSSLEVYSTIYLSMPSVDHLDSCFETLSRRSICSYIMADSNPWDYVTTSGYLQGEGLAFLRVTTKAIALWLKIISATFTDKYTMPHSLSLILFHTFFTNASWLTLLHYVSTHISRPVSSPHFAPLE